MRAAVTIFAEQDEDGRMSVHHVITGDLPPQIAADVCRMIANQLDRERIRAEVEAEKGGDDEATG